MITSSLSDALADYAHCVRPEIKQIFATVQTTAPAQYDRLTHWLGQCNAHQKTAITEEAISEALRDLVTLRNGQLTFTVLPVRPGARPEAVVAGDLGGAVALDRVMTDLLRCVAGHDPDLALRLIREVRRTDLRQQTQIGRAIGWR